jgi:hypothetical protein
MREAWTIANLRDLMGVWSWLTITAGLICAAVSYFSLVVGRQIHAPESDTAKVSSKLGAGMFLFALFIALYVVPSGTYSGPPTLATKDVSRYDQCFAMLIALAFSLVFALDAFRLRRHDARAGGQK